MLRDTPHRLLHVLQGSAAPVPRPGQVEDTSIHWPPVNSDSTLWTPKASGDIDFLLPPACPLSRSESLDFFNTPQAALPPLHALTQQTQIEPRLSAQNMTEATPSPRTLESSLGGGRRPMLCREKQKFPWEQHHGHETQGHC